jgi:hypothetical protein
MFIHQPSGLDLTQYRAYDPFSGRWLSRDPAGEKGGINLYAYVGDAPVNYLDPWGLWEFSLSGGAGLGGEIHFGNNGGQWNFGAHGGLGEGAYANFNPNDSGCHAPGSVPSLAASGNIGAGENVDADAEYAPGSPGDSSATVTVSNPLNNTSGTLGEAGGQPTGNLSAGGLSADGSFGLGESSYAGGGGTYYGGGGSGCGCNQ